MSQCDCRDCNCVTSEEPDHGATTFKVGDRVEVKYDQLTQHNGVGTWLTSTVTVLC
jgi:hypothetical protein